MFCLRFHPIVSCFLEDNVFLPRSTHFDLVLQKQSSYECSTMGYNITLSCCFRRAWISYTYHIISPSFMRCLGYLRLSNSTIGPYIGMQISPYIKLVPLIHYCPKHLVSLVVFHLKDLHMKIKLTMVQFIHSSPGASFCNIIASWKV